MVAIVDLAEQTGSSILYDRLNLKPLMRSRLKGVLTPEGLRVVGEVDFTNIYYRLEILCGKRGVKARHAF